MTVQAQWDASGSMLSLYRDALRLRPALPDLHDPYFAWRGYPADMLIFNRGQTLRCVVNLSDRPFPLPGHGAPLLAAALPSQGSSPHTPPAGWTAQLTSKQRIETSVARRQDRT
jgi:alpha-glucosidase